MATLTKPLTPRQVDCVRRLASSHTREQIAFDLNLTLWAVDSLVRSAARALGLPAANDYAGFTRWAIQQHIITL